MSPNPPAFRTNPSSSFFVPPISLHRHQKQPFLSPILALVCLSIRLLHLRTTTSNPSSPLHTTANHHNTSSILLKTTNPSPRCYNIKAHENRKQMFSTNLLRGNPFRQPAKTLTELPRLNSASKFGDSQSSL